MLLVGGVLVSVLALLSETSVHNSDIIATITTLTTYAIIQVRMSEENASGDVFELSPSAAVAFVQHVPVRTINNKACKAVKDTAHNRGI